MTRHQFARHVEGPRKLEYLDYPAWKAQKYRREAAYAIKFLACAVALFAALALWMLP